jgi:hypothetical protein
MDENAEIPVSDISAEPSIDDLDGNARPGPSRVA